MPESPEYRDYPEWVRWALAALTIAVMFGSAMFVDWLHR